MVPISTYLKCASGRGELHLLKLFSKLLAERNGPIVRFQVGRDGVVANSSYLKWASGRDEPHEPVSPPVPLRGWKAIPAIGQG